MLVSFLSVFIITSGLWVALWVLNLRIRFTDRKAFPELNNLSMDEQSLVLRRARECAEKHWKAFGDGANQNPAT